MNSTAASFEQWLDETPMTKTQWQLWLLSAMGVFLDGFDLFIIGVALPLIDRDFQLSPFTQGLVAGAAVVGAFVGSAIGGWATDKLGRKAMFVLDLLFFVVFAAASACAWNAASLIVFRFLLGVGVGADYPIGVSYIAENIPTRNRGKLVVGAFSFQAIGSLAGIAVGLALLWLHPELDAWRWMLGFGILPAAIVVLLRQNLPESPRWYLQRGDYEQAAVAATKLLEKPIAFSPAPPIVAAPPLSVLFRQYSRHTLLATIPWFLQDIATYGIGLFTPTILAVLAGATLAGDRPADFIAQDVAATTGAVVTNLPLVLGFGLATLAVDRWGRIPLQIGGFVGMAIGLGIVAIGSSLPATSPLYLSCIFGGFMLFNLLMNWGPNSTTYLLSGEVFPTSIRATGAGFAAAIAKLGAVLGTFCFPLLQIQLGLSALLILLAIACLLAAALTFGLRIDTTGITLDQIAPNPIAPHSSPNLSDGAAIDSRSEKTKAAQD